jgi:ribosomal protein L16 Arg81 hydroxylase
MGLRTPTFGELVGDEDEFFASYFTQRPLFRPGALAGDMSEILSIADMDDIVHQEGLRSSLFRMLGRGVLATGPALTRRLELRREGQAFEDAPDPDKIYAHYRSGKTLIHAGLNHTRPNLRRLCGILTEKFAAPSEAVAFLTPAGTQAGTAHSDPSDVYIIQLAGSKHWQVWPTPKQRRVGVDREYLASELPEPILDIVLRPGDVLYLPYGTPHLAAAKEQTSLHLTMVALTPTWSRLLAQVLENVLEEDEDFWSVPYLGAAPSSVDEAMRDRLKVLTARLGRLETLRALGRVVDAGRAYTGVAQGSYFQDMAAVDGIDADTKVESVPDSTTFHDVTDGVGQVTINGNRIKLPEDAVAALRSANGGTPLRAGDFLSGRGQEGSLSMVRQLIRLGALRILDDTAHA